MDLFSQAEHDETGAGHPAVAPTPPTSTRCAAAIERLLPSMPRARRHRAPRSKARGALIQARDLDEACDVGNRIAPEHLELAVARPAALGAELSPRRRDLPRRATPARALGDYCAGPNHVLPTAGTARFSSPLGVYDFQKRSSLIEVGAGGRRRRSGRIAADAGPMAKACRRMRARAEMRLDRTERSDDERPPCRAHASRRPRRVQAMHGLRRAPMRRAGQARRDGEPVPACPSAAPRSSARRWRGLALNRYPVPSATRAARAVARATAACPTGCDLMLGNGSDELIELLTAGLRVPGAVDAGAAPAFVMYEMHARGCRRALRRRAAERRTSARRRRDAGGDRARAAGAASTSPIPNNPTGNLFAGSPTSSASCAQRPGWW